MALAFWFFLFERLGDEYFSWWYVQHMHLFNSVFNLQLFLSILLYNLFYLVWKRQTETVNSTQHLLTSIAFFFLQEQ